MYVAIAITNDCNDTCSREQSLILCVSCILITTIVLSRNGGPALCMSPFGTLPYLDPEKLQPKTDGTAEIYALFLPIYAKF